MNLYGYEPDLCDAAELEALQTFNSSAPPCVNCGQPMQATRTCNTSAFGRLPSFAVSESRCSAECWRSNPKGYIAAYEAAQPRPQPRPTPPAPGPRPPNPGAHDESGTAPDRPKPARWWRR